MSKMAAALVGALFMNSLPVPFAQAEENHPSASLTNMALWPDGKMPGDGAEDPEKELESGDDVQRLTNVSRPEITVVKAPGAAAAKPAVVICPGGGYSILAYNKEGSEIAEWLNSIGVTSVLLKYRVPDNREGAFQDIQRAVRLVRAHAKDWGIDPDRIGVMGCSAGGHLCARLSTSFDQAAYATIDNVDKVSCRPDFTLLIYPAFLADKEGKLLPEFTVSPRTPATFIVHTEDDKAFIAGSHAYHAALQAAKVPTTFCWFATGGHGYGLRSQKEVCVWPQQCQEWLIKRGCLRKSEAKK